MAAVAAGCMSLSAHASNLVYNGSFELTRGGVFGFPTDYVLSVDGNAELWAPDGGGYNDAAVTGWTYEAYKIGTVFLPDGISNSAYPKGSYSTINTAYLEFSNDLGVDPDGGKFVGLIGDNYSSPLTQTITGLTPGQVYDLGFYQATDHYGPFGDYQASTLVVSLGAESHAAPTLEVTHGGLPWSHVSMRFTATSAVEALSFLNQGQGVPPYALLDGVTLTPAAPAPEPAEWLVLSLGLAGVGAALRGARANFMGRDYGRNRA